MLVLFNHGASRLIRRLRSLPASLLAKGDLTPRAYIVSANNANSGQRAPPPASLLRRQDRRPTGDDRVKRRSRQRRHIAADNKSLNPLRQISAITHLSCNWGQKYTQ